MKILDQSPEKRKAMRNEIQFHDNCVSTAKIKSEIKNRKKKLKDAKLQEVTNNTSCKTKLRYNIRYQNQI